jgi:hypothetical protein
MGTTAFVLLMAGELSISLLLAGRSAAEHLQLYWEASHMLGLAGQVAFALFPVLQISMASSPSGRREERSMMGFPDLAERRASTIAPPAARHPGRTRLTPRWGGCRDA